MVTDDEQVGEKSSEYSSLAFKW